MDKGMRSEFRKLLNSRRSISCRFVHHAYRLFRFATMRLGKKSGARMLVKICAPVAQMDQSGRFLNGKSRFDSGREHHFSPLFSIKFRASNLIPHLIPY